MRGWFGYWLVRYAVVLFCRCLDSIVVVHFCTRFGNDVLFCVSLDVLGILFVYAMTGFCRRFVVVVVLVIRFCGRIGYVVVRSC